jgi:hypothetical protein
MFSVCLLVSGCKPQHPVSVDVTPAFNAEGENGRRAVEKIAVLNFASALNHADDPDGTAPKTMTRYFVPALQSRGDYKFIAPGTVDYAVGKTSTPEAYEKFLRSFAMTDKVDMQFLAPLAAELQCDAFLIPVVDLWQKDEIDITETSTPATYVGATITVVSAKDGSVLLRCSDEDYVEGASAVADDRGVISTAGTVRSDPGAKIFRAPPFDDVAPKVAAALVSGLPAR